MFGVSLKSPDVSAKRSITIPADTSRDFNTHRLQQTIDYSCTLTYYTGTVFGWEVLRIQGGLSLVVPPHAANSRRIAASGLQTQD
jgi:hypothetical protein